MVTKSVIPYWSASRPTFASYVKILRPAITPTVLRPVYLVMSLLFCSSPPNGLMIVRRSLLNACWHRSKIKTTHHLAIFPLLPVLVLRLSLKMANTLRNCCSMPIPPCIKRKMRAKTKSLTIRRR
ncbi:Uncharacterised protein [Vibrio cholerae]|nr:Uncharacterised protein [Vibrio cholerae]